MIALFAGWKMDKAMTRKEFLLGAELPPEYFSVWHFLMRYVVPMMIAVVFFSLI